MRRQRFVLGIALFCPLLSCGPSRSAPAVAVSPAAEKQLPELPLAEYLPPTGVRYLLQVKPRGMIQSPELRKQLEGFLSAERLEAFSWLTGAPPENVTELWIASYELGTLFLIDAKTVGPEMEKKFVARATTSQLQEREGFRFISATTSEGPAAFVHQPGHFVAWAQGDPTLARLVAARAEGRIAKAPPALATSTFRDLKDFAPDAVARLFLPGPLPDSKEPATALFTSFGLAAEVKDEKLHLRLAAFGLWDEPREEVLTDFLVRFLKTPVAKLLGATLLTNAPDVHCQNSSGEAAREPCFADFTIPLAPLANQLAWLKGANLGELAPERSIEAQPPSSD